MKLYRTVDLYYENIHEFVFEIIMSRVFCWLFIKQIFDIDVFQKSSFENYELLYVNKKLSVIKVQLSLTKVDDNVNGNIRNSSNSPFRNIKYFYI
ncbi:MAG: hypothetical protein JEY97_04215 [Bacteroidales bacterium]|nr:hypothetical protein [Bacteroidales bacterium]